MLLERQYPDRVWIIILDITLFIDYMRLLKNIYSILMISQFNGDYWYIHYSTALRCLPEIYFGLLRLIHIFCIDYPALMIISYLFYDTINWFIYFTLMITFYLFYIDTINWLMYLALMITFYLVCCYIYMHSDNYFALMFMLIL